MAELVNSIDTFEYDGLIGGCNPAVSTKNVTIASGAGKLVRGTVLGVITTSGKYTTVNSTNTDGSQTAKAILVYDVDATSADVITPVYWAGPFNREALVFGGTDTADTHEDALRDVNILLTSEQ
ncbi:hypothetical protein SPSIL_008980 [Sporomusa silvacetica DSM 10669]|uniref:Head decoration protein n=1 Tax=Sporomusa silvacetica DSM 10669 TaxID=1123289 RepID=A0ABZ3IGI2_9FIRM|nr:head decoration protein [Sporomusa silvacetica]OZC13142.1 hypothetical protein SPSIL_55980 [Sporomusa silvacetica DSM 10669]